MDEAQWGDIKFRTRNLRRAKKKVLNRSQLRFMTRVTITAKDYLKIEGIHIDRGQFSLSFYSQCEAVLKKESHKLIYSMKISRFSFV